MTFTFQATVNYPSEVHTKEISVTTGLDMNGLSDIAWKLIRNEPQASSFVITIVREQG